jgi:signal peptidase II
MTSNPKIRSPRTRLQCIMLASLVFIADQAVKYAMAVPLQLKSRTVIHIMQQFDLRWAENRGISLSFLVAQTDLQRWLLVGMTTAIALFIAIWMWREKQRGDALALSMVLGGALGNIVDRSRFGYVIDYADLHLGEWRPFQIFNLADAAISIGVVILLARALLLREKGSDSDGEAVHRPSIGVGISE